MTLWWLEPGWKDASCGMCGQNIWGSGGDPDHGLCWPCWNENWERNNMRCDEVQQPDVADEEPRQ